MSQAPVAQLSVGRWAGDPHARRWPVTLWLYVLKDMLRLIGLTAVVLVTVIAFAASVKPLADGQLTPVQCVKFMGLAMLPMLQYALPFAACFGATLAYYRLASDNEVTAAHAGGLSHRVLLAPTLATGVVLAVVVWWLGNFTIPRFLRNMSEMVSQNATQFIESSIQQGRALQTRIAGQDAYVYADFVKPYPRPEGDSANAYDRLWLGGILFVTLNEQGQVVSQGTAREAMLWIRRGGGDSGEASGGAGSGATGGTGEGGDASSSTEVVLQPVDPRFFQEKGRAEVGQMVRSFRVPNAFRDDPKFMTLGELLSLSRHPERLPQVDKRRKSLALILAENTLAEQMRGELHAGRACEFRDSRGVRYFLKARDLRPSRNVGWWRILPARGQRITVDRVTGDNQPAQGYSANYAEMKITRGRDPLSEEEFLSVHLRLGEVSGAVSDETDLPPPGGTGGGTGDSDGAGDDAGRGGVTRREIAGAGAVTEWPINDLVPTLAEGTGMLGGSAESLIAATDERLGAAATGGTRRPGALDERTKAALSGARNELVRRTDDLLREIFSKHHERFAYSFACLVMVITGSVMAMRLRESLPLKIYLWAFFPALGAVLTISTGQQMTHQNGPVGLLVLWGGVAALCVYTWVEFSRLARN